MPCSRLVGPSGLLLALLPLTASAVSYNYSLQDTYAGSNFYDGFNFFTDPDPTHGFVQYVDQATAVSSGILGYGTGNTAKWGVDDTNVLYANSTGRQSVRLEGKVNYNHGLFLADIKHMPGSICGVWPAFWTLGDSTWPAHGELDIIEGVNMGSTNQIAAHTAPNCTMKFQNQTGWANGYDCAVSTGGAAGCATGTNDQTGYGDGFNANGGGVYAMQWTSEFMKVWFFPRNAIPASISSGSPSPALDFGTPVGNFDGGSCDIDSHFINHRMVFDTTFCGNWAGSVYSSTSCPLAGTSNGCVEYVAGNPSAFKDAYWEVNYIKVFSETVVADPTTLDLNLNFDQQQQQQQQQQHPLNYHLINLIIHQNLNHEHYQQHQQQTHHQLLIHKTHFNFFNHHKTHFDFVNFQTHNHIFIHKIILIHKFQTNNLEHFEQVF
ncbi:glycoside hydrolase family 16 protein, partial [Aureobasidium melanogenum]